MIPAVYAPHAAFVAPARDGGGIGRLVVGILLVEFLFAIGLGLFTHGIRAVAPGFFDAMFYGRTPLGLSLQLAAFAIFAASLALVLRRQHGRSLSSALGPVPLAADHAIRVAGAVALLFVALEVLPPWWSADTLAEVRNVVLWTLALPLGLGAILIQVTAEELFYRGYVQQQLAARFDSPLVWLLIPNLLFAAAHFDNGGGGAESWRYVIWAFCFGIAASDLTARTGTLGAAIGLHLANNAYAFLIFAELGAPDSGLALFLFAPEAPLVPPAPGAMPEPVLTAYLLIDIGIVGLSWLTARLALRR